MKPKLLGPFRSRSLRESEQARERARRRRINAMENELGIALTVWDEPGSTVGDACTTEPPSSRAQPATARAGTASQGLSSNAPVKAAKVRDDTVSSVWVTDLTDTQLAKLRVHYETKGETGNHSIVCTEIARRATANTATVKVRDDIPKWVKATDLTDLQLDRLRTFYETKGETDKHTIVCTEIARRVTIKKAKGTAAGTEEERKGTGSTPPPSSAGQMTIEEAVVQAKAEGYDYDKRVAHRYQESLKRSPLELRMQKKRSDETGQWFFAKGDYDTAVVFSARSEGIRQALDERARQAAGRHHE